MDYDEVPDLLGLRLAYVEGRNGYEGALGALESWSIVSLRLKDL